MVKRIFHSICFVTLAVLLASFVLIMGALYHYFSGVQQNQLKVQTVLAAQGVSHEGIQYFEHLKTDGFRITWIDSDGEVLYDSQQDAAQMENHLEREEIQEALKQGCGESKRYSATLMERMLYCAQLLEDGTVIRLSAVQYTVLTLILGIAQPICIVVFVAVALSVLLAVRLSRKIVEPLNGLNLDEPLNNKEYDELSPLLRRIDNQQTQLKWQEEQLLQKQTELDAIVGNMKEGMILLNSSGKIISINPAAGKLLNTDSCCIGRDILTVSRNLKLQEVFVKALEGEAAEQTVILNGGSYQVDASPVISENAVSGAAVLLLDVTEKEKAEQMRREFTANVSHELKTPLHTISGYAELLKNNMVENKDRVPFAEKIYAETQRMVRLVEDIISLSRLDEGAGDMKYEAVDLYRLAQTVILALESEAEGAGIFLELSGENAVINGIPQLLYSMIYNLCDNGIKYNHKGGSVRIEVKREETAASVLVKDTGIGIGYEHQERIFERFYRVDKSRSKEAGGTGLGLSIVKHAAKIHNARIELHSIKGEGTSIAVNFPAGSNGNDAILMQK
ncbi:MAG TPA: PAS domain-containing sensor histidine kinase [Lachnospiraceae bacterium]|nr:PAS domain-containing sensor histidine kinase [Lachnospiraceae bacterium]